MHLGIMLWIVCGVLAYGKTLGSFTKRYPYFSHIGIATFTSLLGWGGLVVLLAIGLGDGTLREWRWRALTKEERWAAYHEECPYASRERFEQND